ncbi:PPOX class F420-dependent oxidoreductase [Salinibacterium sp. ZJ77]|uniref:PPOX class F420-dependent oxidoreductase n=1 Tax=Salinibacterium sp. ZJ77 TaxID=2708337 RepID=UPI001FBA152F|nr:PPOX class F420-dependent oxidoreductase [Salinibacterium sp. ZJ77]
MSDTAFADLARATYVLLTTYRRSGDPVSTPVWIVGDGDRLLVTTGAKSGKVKRLAHTSRVTLTPCDVRGKVKPGTPEVEANAVVDDRPETRDALDAALLKKYGLQYRLIRSRQKKNPHDSVPVVITR